jgi:hypothetical protein
MAIIATTATTMMTMPTIRSPWRLPGDVALRFTAAEVMENPYAEF